MVKALEQNLIHRCRQGDPDSFGHLIKLYRKQLYGYLFRLLGNTVHAEEAMQETLIKVWKGIKKYNEEQKFASWLFTIAHNCAMDFLRIKKHDSQVTEEDPDNLPGYENPARQIEKEELKIMIAKTVETLPVQQKEVFLLRIEGDFSFKEIAQIMGSPLNTVLSHMNYAVKKIRKRVMYESL